MFLVSQLKMFTQNQDGEAPENQKRFRASRWQLSYWSTCYNLGSIVSVWQSFMVAARGGTPRKVGWRCAAHFPKPLPYLWPKSAIFPTLFMTWPKIQYPIYDRCGRHSCPKHKLWRAFINGLINNNEKVASSKKHTQFRTRVRKPYPI